MQSPLGRRKACPYHQVNAGVEVHVAHPAPHGHVGAPLCGVVPDEVAHHRVQAVERLQVRVGVDADEAQFEVDALPGQGSRGVGVQSCRGKASAAPLLLCALAPLLKDRHPDGILGQPHGACAAPHLEAGALVELAHVLDEHDRAAVQGLGHTGAVRGQRRWLLLPCHQCRAGRQQGCRQEGHKDVSHNGANGIGFHRSPPASFLRCDAPLKPVAPDTQ